MGDDGHAYDERTVSSPKKASSDDGSFFGPLHAKRRCTDILFLLLLIASWAAMTGIGLAATGVIESKSIAKGNPARLTSGMDYYGNICGVTTFELPNGNNTINLPYSYILPSGSAVCIDACPEQTDLDQYHCKYETQAEVENQVALIDISRGQEAANSTRQSLYLLYTTLKQCMPHIKSSPYLGYCRPDEESIERASDAMNLRYVANDIAASSNITIATDGDGGVFEYDSIMADVQTSRYIIIGFGLGAALALGFVFLLLIRAPGILATLIWSIIALVLAALIVGGLYMRRTSAEWEAEGVKDEREVRGLLYLSYASHAAAIMWCLLTLCCRKRIILAIACTREASKALSCIPIIVFYPILQVLGLFSFLLPWLYFMVYLASSGEVKAECICPQRSLTEQQDEDSFLLAGNNSSVAEDGNLTGLDLINDTFECNEGCFMYKSFTYAENTQYAGLFMLFVWFWTSQFIIAVGQLTVATAVSAWYFTKEKGAIGNWTLCRAMMLVTMYHLGTCSFGSLIIAVVKTIRAVVSYVQKKAARVGRSNKIGQIILAVLQCLLWCLEKCLKFINKNAYIQTAIFGYPFCKAAKESFFLILRNILRISAVSLVSAFVLLVGKIFIVAGAATGAFFYLDYHESNDLNGLWVPIVVVICFAYATAEASMQVFGMAISTILQCFVIDEEMNSPEERFAPGSLASTIDSTQRSKTVSQIVHPETNNDEKKRLLESSTPVKRRTTVEKKTSFMKRLVSTS